MLYTEGLHKVECPNFERRAASGFSAFEETALIRDYLLGLRPTPTREISGNKWDGLAIVCVQIRETVDHAEVALASEDDLKMLRDRASRVGESLPEE